MIRSITVRQQEFTLLESSTRGGLFGMDMETLQRGTELNAEQGEEEQNPEAQVVRTKKAPELHIQAEVTAHDAVDCPYRSWCEVCAFASGKKMPVHGRKASMKKQDSLSCHWITSSWRAR